MASTGRCGTALPPRGAKPVSGHGAGGVALFPVNRLIADATGFVEPESTNPTTTATSTVRTIAIVTAVRPRRVSATLEPPRSASDRAGRCERVPSGPAGRMLPAD